MSRSSILHKDLYQFQRSFRGRLFFPKIRTNFNDDAEVVYFTQRSVSISRFCDVQDIWRYFLLKHGNKSVVSKIYDVNTNSADKYKIIFFICKKIFLESIPLDTSIFALIFYGVGMKHTMAS